jgi:hypothetical protein
MKKKDKRDLTKKLPESLVDVKFKIDKRKCQHCARKFNGTKYQKWCVPCKDIINKIDWDWALWI